MKKIYIDVRYFFLSLGRRIKNLWRWLPIIWNDRDYDDHYIFEVLKFKIKNTADYIEQRQWFVGYEHEVARMRLCVKLIELFQEERYGMEYMDYEETTFEFVPTDHKDENGDPYYEMKSEMIEDRLDDYFIKYPLIYKKVVNKLGSTENRKRIALYMGKENHERAKRLLFKVLDTHIERWWD